MKNKGYVFLVIALGLAALGVYISAVMNMASLTRQVEQNTSNLKRLESGKRVSPQQPPTPAVKPTSTSKKK